MDGKYIVGVNRAGKFVPLWEGNNRKLAIAISKKYMDKNLLVVIKQRRAE